MVLAIDSMASLVRDLIVLKRVAQLFIILEVIGLDGTSLFGKYNFFIACDNVDVA